jgi:hypothetical protein
MRSDNRTPGASGVGLFVVVVLTAVLAGLALGCGGSSSSTSVEVGSNIKPGEFHHQKPKPLTMVDFRRSLETTCANVDKELAELEGPPANVGAMKAIGAMTNSGLGLVRPPKSAAQTYATFLQDIEARERTRGGVFTRGVPPKERAQFVKRYKFYTAKATAVAKRLGLRHCPYR